MPSPAQAALAKLQVRRPSNPHQAQESRERSQLLLPSRTMASVRNLILASAALLVLSMSVEFGSVEAQSCNSQAILSQMSPCLADKNNPNAVVKGSACCNSVNDVYNQMHPTDTCMCTTANMVSGAGVTNAQVAKMLGTCMSPSMVPSCLSS